MLPWLSKPTSQFVQHRLGCRSTVAGIALRAIARHDGDLFVRGSSRKTRCWPTDAMYVAPSGPISTPNGISIGTVSVAASARHVAPLAIAGHGFDDQRLLRDVLGTGSGGDCRQDSSHEQRP